MTQSPLHSEIEKITNTIKYLKENKVINIKSQFQVNDSIKRLNKKNFDLTKPSEKESHKKTIEEFKEQLNKSTEDIIYLFYEMETLILTNCFIPFEVGKRLQILKAMIFLCKKALSLPDPDEITFPEEFIEEYTALLQRADKAISSVKSRIEKLNTMDGIESLKCVLEKNLLTLKMLHFHYVSALGLATEN